MTSAIGFHSDSERQLHEGIAEAAYFCAERRGFTPRHEIEDWLQAERGIERALGALSARSAQLDIDFRLAPPE